MGIGAGLYTYDVVVEKFTLAISSPDEFLLIILTLYLLVQFSRILVVETVRCSVIVGISK